MGRMIFPARPETSTRQSKTSTDGEGANRNGSAKGKEVDGNGFANGSGDAHPTCEASAICGELGVEVMDW